MVVSIASANIKFCTSSVTFSKYPFHNIINFITSETEVRVSPHR